MVSYESVKGLDEGVEGGDEVLVEGEVGKVVIGLKFFDDYIWGCFE